MFNNPNITPDFFTALGAGLLSGPTWQQQAGNALTGASTALKTSTDKEKQLAFLKAAAPSYYGAAQAGILKPEDAYSQMLSDRKNPNIDFVQVGDKYGYFDKTAKSFTPLGTSTKPAALPSSAEEYEYAKKNGFTGTYMDWVNAKSGLKNEYGLNPTWTIGPDNKYHLMVSGKDASVKELKMPDGYIPQPGVSTVDSGTSTNMIDKKTGQVVGNIPKDVAGVSTQQALGKTQGEIQASLAGAKQTAEMVKSGVQDLINDPGLSGAVGPIDSRLPTFLPSTARAESKINMLKGQAFMQARQLLKGGGQITDFEGQRAEDAYARMSTAQNEDDFKKALVDFNSAVQDGVAKLEAQSQGQWDYSKQQTQNPASPTRINNSDDYAKLPVGAQYLDPNGVPRTKR